MTRILLCVGLVGCATAPSTLDLSDEPIDVAVALGIDHLEQAYSFTEHKRIDWDVVRDELQPLADAASTPEEEAHVLRRLVPYLPDAHVQLFHDDGDDLCPEARHSYDVTLTDLDDGRVIVAASGGPLEPGDTIVSWGGQPVDVAREGAPFWCFPLGAATNERRAQVQLKLLGRGPVGSTVDVEVLRDGVPRTETLSARPDTDDIRVALGIELPETMVDHRRLPSGMAYVRVGWEETYLAETRVQRALVGMRDAPGLVLDLRDNDGGMDMPAANIAGMFSTERFFYETVTFLNHRTFEQETIAELWVEPQEVYWGRPTAVLIDADTVSSGEGLTYLLKKMPQVQVFGFEGTAASFGSTGSGIDFPGGWHLTFPGGRALDERGRILLDSDHTLEGGNRPDQRLPWTEELVLRHHAGEDVVLEAAVGWLKEATR